MAIQVKTKKWGNSIAIIIPSDTIAEMNIKPNEEVVVEIERKRNVLMELFGSGKQGKKSTKQILEEFREATPDSKWW